MNGDTYPRLQYPTVCDGVLSRTLCIKPCCISKVRGGSMYRRPRASGWCAYILSGVRLRNAYSAARIEVGLTPLL